MYMLRYFERAIRVTLYVSGYDGKGVAIEARRRGDVGDGWGIGGAGISKDLL